MLWAHVEDRRIRAIIKSDSRPHPRTNLDIRDITRVVPVPAEGWVAFDDGTYGEVAPPLTIPGPLKSLEFRWRFTEAEQVAIELATESHPNPQVRAALRVLDKSTRDASVVYLTDPRTVGGVNRLVAFGLLTAERAEEILDAKRGGITP